ncbi:uncharacterized protein CIMG_13560 [Coccidioides immitis RS]|uniref:Uncharacterized protein n=1 Tax=Coccidioides immitis (strain RS) TaxID=246410 RepID=J3K170_COCIM|nr:uncharacterized protein CIMG_13560 [Coccidioides immitis RS]EAS27688.3 hypothetical protein CIMG_13560 [Coccidioides immitis RS]
MDEPRDLPAALGIEMRQQSGEGSPRGIRAEGRWRRAAPHKSLAAKRGMEGNDS